MVGRRFLSLLRRNRATPPPTVEEGKSASSYGRKLVSGALICLTGGVALSAVNDLLIFYGCSSNAMAKASADQRIMEAIGEPIVRGPWYNASLAVAHKRQSVSCSFPVSGSRGTGMLQLKAMRNEDSNLFSFFRPTDWDILILEALLHVPENDKSEQTFRITISDNPSSSSSSPACQACNRSEVQQPPNVGNSQTSAKVESASQ